MSTSKRSGKRFLALLLALLAAAPFLLGAAANAAQSPMQSNGSMGQALNSTASYINTINQSSYLLFYPNLTRAYNYLSMARNESQTNVTYAYMLLGKANQSAKYQEYQISKYQQLSLLVLIALAVLLGVVLYFFMRPNKRRRR